MSDAKAVFTQFYMPQIGTQFVMDHPGIVVIGIYPRRDLPGLVMVWDDVERNDGVSATHCLDSILPWLDRHWAPDFPLRDSAIIQRDAAGDFDLVQPQWNHRAEDGRVALTWLPVKWPGTEMRSAQAFEGAFGSTAGMALATMQVVEMNEMAVGGKRPN